MAWIGRYQLGQSISLFLVTRNADGTPAVPESPPVASISLPGGTVVLAKEMPVVDRYQYDGLFLLPVFLGGLFAEGLYSVAYQFAVGGLSITESDNFQVLPGGNADGNVVSMYFYERPQARFIVQQLDSGKIVQGRNPTM